MANLPNCPKCGDEYTYEDGNELADGDTVVVVKDLKVKGAGVLKQGTRVKNIRLITDASDGHDIDCKIDGFGAMALKSEMVKKI
ncbi:MAG: alkylphosphonate utilization protein [Veillonella sp.]|nr:alkylphosphonate utilization protein [Veillonella sp.]